MRSEENILYKGSVYPFITDDGAVFVMSNGNMLYGMDIFGISASGEKWMRSIPFNHGVMSTYEKELVTGTGIQIELFEDQLYIVYADNRQNLVEFYPQNYRRPNNNINTHHYLKPLEDRIITFLRMSDNGDTELFKVIDHAHSEVRLIKMEVTKNEIKLGAVIQVSGPYQYGKKRTTIAY
jgi:hypothetical protein